MLYLGVSETHEAQLNILQALTRKFSLHSELDLAAVAERCPFNYTGADFYALCSDALLSAMTRKAEELDQKIGQISSLPKLLEAEQSDTERLDKLPGPYDHPYPLTAQYYLAEMASPEDTDVTVTHADFMKALNNLVPSVSQSEMEHYGRVQKQFSRQKQQ